MKYNSVVQITIAIALTVSAPLSSAAPKINIFKTRTCGCCAKWVEHLKANGFDVSVQEVSSTAEYRQKYGVPDKLQSCHTATVNGYSIEGHVPAADIQRLIKTKPKAAGLAVPGMPAGSPGMEGPRSDAYSVVLFDATGHATVYQNYPGN